MIAKSPFLLETLAIINIAGTLFGFWYYRYQLAQTPAEKLIFVPDCPLYTLLFAALLSLHLLRKNTDPLAAITYIGLIKYGFWTLLVIALYSNYYFASEPILYIVLFILHSGMIAEALIIPHLSRFNTGSLGLALVWFIANDVMDYFYGTKPALPSEYHTSLLAIESFIMTIALVLYSRKHTS